jgi:hypothetical protein
MYRAIQVKINVPNEIRDYPFYECRHSNSLINSTIYYVKQSHYENCPKKEYFSGDEYKTGFKTLRVKTAKYANLCLQFKDNPHYKSLGGQSGQQTPKSLFRAILWLQRNFVGLFLRANPLNPRCPDTEPRVD